MPGKKKVLLIDDDPVVKLVMRKVADKYGGEATQKALRELEGIDAVFPDLFMPHFSGRNILKQIKASPVGPDIPGGGGV